MTAKRKKGFRKKSATKHVVVPQKELEPAIDDIRARHPKVTDLQAEIVRMAIHTGWGITKIAEELRITLNTARYHAHLDHVAAYRQELAMAVLGWDASVAQGTLLQLLSSKSDYVRLEAARDIVNRAGLGRGASAPTSAAPITLNLGLALSPVSPTEVVSTVECQAVSVERSHEPVGRDMGPMVMAPSRPGFEKARVAGERGSDTHDQGSGSLVSDTHDLGPEGLSSIETGSSLTDPFTV